MSSKGQINIVGGVVYLVANSGFLIKIKCYWKYKIVIWYLYIFVINFNKGKNVVIYIKAIGVVVLVIFPWTCI